MNKQSYKKSADLRQQLLDVAEQLFSEKGYYGTSIRDITEKVGTRLASVNYHFESKEKLFLEVIRRRVQPLSQARLAKLHALEINPKKPRETVYGLVTSFAGPMVDFCNNGGPGWRNYCVLIAQVAAQRTWSKEFIGEEYDPVAKTFIAALAETFPGLDDFRLHCCFQFLLGTMLYMVCDNQRIDILSDGKYTSNDIERMSHPFYDYATGGILATASEFSMTCSP